MKVTKDQYQEFQDDNAGYCSHCDNVTTSDIEPDAENIECSECGNNSVKGIENALIYGDVEIEGEESSDEEYDEIISFSEDDDGDL